MEKENKVTFLLNKIRDCFEKANKCNKTNLNTDRAVFHFKMRYETLNEEHLDNVIKSNGLDFYMVKNMKEVA